MRHHSFGLMRDWKNFHRYAMHFINLENGDKISVGILSIPFVYSRLYFHIIIYVKSVCIVKKTFIFF